MKSKVNSEPQMGFFLAKVTLAQQSVCEKCSSLRKQSEYTISQNTLHMTSVYTWGVYIGQSCVTGYTGTIEWTT